MQYPDYQIGDRVVVLQGPHVDMVVEVASLGHCPIFHEPEVSYEIDWGADDGIVSFSLPVRFIRKLVNGAEQQTTA